MDQSPTQATLFGAPSPEMAQSIGPIEPPTTTNRDLFFRTAGGVFGGLAGTIVLLICLIVVTRLFSGVDLAEAATSPIFLFALFLSIFFTALSANVLAAALVFLFNREKYKKLFGTLSQIFWLNVMVFVFMIPVYWFANSSGLTAIIYPMGLHILLAAFLSALVQEIISNRRYFMIGMYGITFGMLLVFVLGLSFAFRATESFALQGGLVVLYPPLLWGCMMFCGTMAEMTYRFIYTIFGVDFLGEIAIDEEEETPEDEEEEEEAMTTSL